MILLKCVMMFLTTYLSANICFIDPCVSASIKCSASVDSILSPLDLINKSYVFIPINDAEAESESGGFLWSLLFYRQTNKQFYYFDSKGHDNIHHAKRISSKMSSYICSFNTTSFKVVDSPQQNNNVDCSIYLTLFTEWLIKSIIENTLDTDINNCLSSLVVSSSGAEERRACLAYLTYNDQYTKLDKITIENMLLRKNCKETAKI